MLRLLLACFVLSVVMISCDQKAVYHTYETTLSGWPLDTPVRFEFENKDSLATHDIFVTMRVNHEYPYSNLFLITSLGFPNGKVETDTLEYKMAEPSGALLGKGIGDIKEQKLWYKEGFRFRESGTYTFTVGHAMRANGNVQGDALLEGVNEVGIRIERQEQ